MKPGDRIIFTAHWSSFYGYRGAVAMTKPHLMVLIDGDSYPIRVGAKEIAPEDMPTEPNLTGAE